MLFSFFDLFFVHSLNMGREMRVPIQAIEMNVLHWLNQAGEKGKLSVCLFVYASFPLVSSPGAGRRAELGGRAIRKAGAPKGGVAPNGVWVKMSHQENMDRRF